MVISGVALAYPSTEADLIGFIGFALVLITQIITHFKLNPDQVKSDKAYLWMNKKNPAHEAGFFITVRQNRK